MEGHELILTKVKEIIAEKADGRTDVDHMSESTPLIGGHLGLDSFQRLEVLMGVEEAFGLSFDYEELDLSLLASIGTVVEYIERRVPNVEEVLAGRAHAR